MHAMSSDELIRKLKEAGWRLARVNGSHHIFVHPQKRRSAVVPHPRKDLTPGVVHTVLKVAGLK